MELFQQTAAQVSELPGSLVYQLVLLFAAAAAAAVAFNSWWRTRTVQPRDPAAARLALATGGFFLLRTASLALALLAAAGVLNPLILPPPFERAAATLTTLLILWLIAFPRPARLADAAFAGAAVLVLVALGISWGLWTQDARVTAAYNNSFQETLWELAQLILLVAGLVGLIVLAVRRHPNAVLGCVMLALLLTGHLLHYAFPIAGTNVPGAERLFELVALPLLAAIAFWRLPVATPSVAPDPARPVPARFSDALTQAQVPPARTAPAAALALAALGAASTPAELAPAIARGVALLLQQPLALVLTPPVDNQDGLIAAAYDVEQRQRVTAGLPALHHSPDLMAALERGEAPIWTPDERETELRSLAFAAGHEALAPMLTLPLRADSGQLLAIVAVMPAPGQAVWPPESAALLASLGAPLAAAWQRTLAAPPAATDGVPLTVLAERDAALLDAARLKQETRALIGQRQAIQHAASVHADQLHEVDSLRTSLLALQPELDQTRQREVAVTTELARLRAEWDQATPPAEAAALRAELAAAQAQLADLTQRRADFDQAAAAAPDVAQAAAAENAAQIEGLRAELAAAQAQLAAAPAAFDDLRATLTLLSAEIESYRAREADLAGQLQQLQSQAGTAPLNPAAAPDRPSPAANGAHVDAPFPAAAQAELAVAHQQIVRLQTELDLTRAEVAQRPASHSAAGLTSFDDPEGGLAEMLEALAHAEARLTQQAADLAAARQALTESERLRLAQPMYPGSIEAPTRPVQAADMEVIASLAQELRQPMSSIIGYADLLLSESVGLIGALQRKFLERIKASSERIGVLVDDLMRVMDIDSGNLTLAPESVDVSRVVDDVLHTTSGQFVEKNLRLVCDVSPHLPPVQADRDALVQIFSHLLSNSGAASANDSEVRLTVQLQTEQRPGLDPLNYLIISITDTGGGIAPEDQPRVFSRLYRADAPLIGGLGDNGMGLSIVKALVEGHSGRIWVISDPGVGSTFYVLLPLGSNTARAVVLKPAPL